MKYLSSFRCITFFDNVCYKIFSLLHLTTSERRCKLKHHLFLNYGYQHGYFFKHFLNCVKNIDNRYSVGFRHDIYFLPSHLWLLYLSQDIFGYSLRLYSYCVVIHSHDEGLQFSQQRGD